MWWFHVGFVSIVLVYIHSCCSHAEQRLEEMLQGGFLPRGHSVLETRFYCESPQNSQSAYTLDQTNKQNCAIWWFHVGFGPIMLVYIHRCFSHAEQRLEEMLQGRFLPGGLSALETRFYFESSQN